MWVERTERSLRMKAHVKIGAPYPESINKVKFLKTIFFGKKSIELVKGGWIAKNIMIKELGDTSDDIIVCNAAVAVSIEVPW